MEFGCEETANRQAPDCQADVVTSSKAALDGVEIIWATMISVTTTERLGRIHMECQ